MSTIQKGVLYLHTETVKENFARNLVNLTPNRYEVHVYDAKPTATMIELAELAASKGLQIFAKHPDMLRALKKAGIAAESKMFSAIVRGELQTPVVSLG